MDTVTEIKNRADIVELISQYTPLSRSGKTLKGLCPFHSEKHGSFFVYPDNQTWHCFGACATGGDIFSFIMKKEGLTFGEALERLAEKYGIQLPSRYQPTPEHDRLDDLFRLNAAAAQYFHDLLLTSPAADKARAYLDKRGVNAGSIADFQLGYALPEWQALKDHLNQAGYPDDMLLEAGLLGRADTGRLYDRFRDQVIIPIADVRGRITGFGARVLNDSQPKYLNSPETPLFSKSATLFGINLAASAIRQADTAIIVEGYLDVIISHQYGFKNTVASMGTAITEKQIGILKKLSRQLVLALDADVAGEEAMTRCVPFENLLESEIKVAVAPAGQDPDDVIRHDSVDWTNLIALAGPLVDFVFNHAAIGFDLRTAAGKSGLAEKLLPVVAGIKDPVRRGHYLAELAGRVGATTADLQYSLNRLKQPPAPHRLEPGAPATVAPPPALASPIEDYFLALLLKHPELKPQCKAVKPEYFESVENREIYAACLASDDLAVIRQRLDAAIRDGFDRLLGAPAPDNRLAERLSECALRLEEKHLKATAIKIKDVLNAEIDKGSSAEILKFQEQGLALDSRLAELFKRKEDRHRGPGR
ncbi:DNA primase [Dehalogenimonas sp. THU2]|uniref:DNA primase n=1 Tax=Dehalogenimonas sp. THU2 TaxID=3151121 RepID=UPI003218C925